MDSLWSGLPVLVMVLALSFAGCGNMPTAGNPQPAQQAAVSVEREKIVKLPEPKYDSTVSVEKSLLGRRSVRSYSTEAITLEAVSQLLWAAQGITSSRGLRTAPSAGALYPLELYLVAGDVKGLAPGVYKYRPSGHSLSVVSEGDVRAALASAALGQQCVGQGAAVFVFAAIYERTTIKYGDRGIRYVHMEIGHAAQNLCLQATAIGLGAVTVGAFSDEQVARTLNLPDRELPVYIIPVGWPAASVR